MDLHKAMLTPDQVFASPQEVLDSDEINLEQKQQILEKWAYEAKLLETADDENMTGGDPDILPAIQAALRQLQELQ